MLGSNLSRRHWALYQTLLRGPCQLGQCQARQKAGAAAVSEDDGSGARVDISVIPYTRLSDKTPEPFPLAAVSHGWPRRGRVGEWHWTHVWLEIMKHFHWAVREEGREIVPGKTLSHGLRILPPFSWQEPRSETGKNLSYPPWWNSSSEVKYFVCGQSPTLSLRQLVWLRVHELHIF